MRGRPASNSGYIPHGDALSMKLLCVYELPMQHVPTLRTQWDRSRSRPDNKCASHIVRRTMHELSVRAKR